MNFIVTNGEGLNVRSQMSTTNPKNLLRKMSPNEGFTVFETYNVKGISGLQIWGRVSDNPGGISQEYVCLSIGNKVYAKKEETPNAPENLHWAHEVDSFLRTLGYTGSMP
jgi:hypothetical protein